MLDARALAHAGSCTQTPQPEHPGRVHPPLLLVLACALGALAGRTSDPLEPEIDGAIGPAGADGADVAEGGTPSLNNADESMSYSGFVVVTLTAGTHVIDIDFAAASGGTAKIRRARIEIWSAN